MLRPSMYPYSLRPSRTASMTSWEGGPGLRNPIVGLFFACCASAAKLKARSKAQCAKQKSFFLNIFLAESKMGNQNLKLPNYPIGSGQDIGWNGHADLLGSFQIDQQLELGRLLDG